MDMETLQSVFPHLSLNVIRSTYDKVGGNVEDAIDHLLAISDDKSQSNQSIDDDRSENSFRRTSEGVIGSRDHYSHPHGHVGNGSVYSLWQERDHYEVGQQKTGQPDFDYSSNGGSHGNYPNRYTYPTVPRTESYYDYTTTQPYSVEQHQQTTSGDREGQYQLFGWSDYHDSHRSVVPRSSDPSFWNQHQGPSFSRPSAPSTERGTVGSVREHPQPSQVASQSTRPRPMGSDSFVNSENTTLEKKLIILRGLPGSGKSTLARKLEGMKGLICSTDDFFMENGRYNFDPSKLSLNHDKNKTKAENAMKRGFSPVIIDNTNLSKQEMEPYVALGIKYGYSVELREPDTYWKHTPHELARRNSHGIPQYKIERMLDRFDRRVTAKALIDKLAQSRDHSTSNPETKLPTYNHRVGDYMPQSERSPPQSGRSLPWNNGAPLHNHHSFILGGKDADSIPSAVGTKSTSSTDVKVTDKLTQPVEAFPPPPSADDRSHTTKPHQLAWLSWHESHDTSTPCTQEDVSSETTPLPVDSTSSSCNTNMSTSGTTSTASQMNIETDPDLLSLPPPMAVSIPRPSVSDGLPPPFGGSLFHPAALSNQSGTKSLGWGSKYLQDCEGLDDDSDGDYVEDFSTFSSSAGSRDLHDMEEGGVKAGRRHQTEDHVSRATDKVESCTPVEISTPSAQSEGFEVPASKVKSDALAFLHSCFPDQTDDFLLHCWECSHDNINTCMDHIMNLLDTKVQIENTQTSDSNPRSQDNMNTATSHSSTQSGGVDLDTPSKVSNSTISSFHPQQMHSGVQHQIEEDAMFASKLQEELNKSGERASNGSSGKLQNQMPQLREASEHKRQRKKPLNEFHDRDVKEYGEDEGFVLKLTPLLAYKLQDMFGSVQEFLEGDDVSEEDLSVLLSEDLARSVYCLWKETLKARKEARAVMRQLEENQQPLRGDPMVNVRPGVRPGPVEHSHYTTGSPTASKQPPSPVIHAKRSNNRKKNRRKKGTFDQPNQSKSLYQPERSFSAPNTPGPPTGSVPLQEIMHEQYAEEVQSDEYTAMLQEWLNGNMSLRLRVNDLQKKCPNACQKTMSKILIDSGLDFDYAEVYLKNDDSSTITPSSNPQPYYPRQLKTESAQVPATSKSKTSSGEKSYEQYQEFGDPEYRDFRAEAQQHADLRHEAFQKAAKAWKSKQKDLASYYAQQGHTHSVKMADANRRAAELIYLKNASKHSANTVDLHGLHVDEALQVLAEKIHECSGELEVITGRGMHSHGNIPKLKKAVLNYLYRNNFRYYVPDYNTGVVKVQLNKRRTK